MLLDLNKLEQAIADLAIGNTINIRFRIDNSSGQPKTTHLQGEPVTNKYRHVESVAGVWMDIGRKHQHQPSRSKLTRLATKRKPQAIQILMVDDEAQDCHLIEHISQRTEPTWSFASASSIQDAREQCKSQSFDAILLNVSLPDGSGLNRLQSMRRSVPATPIILLTTNEDRSLLDDGLYLGARGFTTKRNLSVETLIAAIQKAIPQTNVQLSEIGGS